MEGGKSVAIPKPWESALEEKTPLRIDPWFLKTMSLFVGGNKNRRFSGKHVFQPCKHHAGIDVYKAGAGIDVYKVKISEKY